MRQGILHKAAFLTFLTAIAARESLEAFLQALLEWAASTPWFSFVLPTLGFIFLILLLVLLLGATAAREAASEAALAAKPASIALSAAMVFSANALLRPKAKTTKGATEKIEVILV